MPTLHTCIIVLALVVQDAPEAPPGPAAEPARRAQFAAEGLEWHAAFHAELAGLPQLAVERVDDVLLLVPQEDGRVGLTLAAGTAPGAYWLKPANEPGLFRLQITRTAEQEHTVVDLRRLVVDPASGAVTFTHVINSPWMFQADRTHNTLAGNQQVTLLLNELAGDRPLRSLRVRLEGDQVPAGRTVRDVYDAETFEALRQEHAAAFEAYAEPMLAEVGLLAGLDRPDLAAALQVLAPQLPVPDQRLAQVQQLVAQLDAEAFAQRQRAQQQLAAMGRDAAVVLLGLDASGFSMEQASAVDALLAEDRPLEPAEARRLADDPDFLARVLLIDDAALRTAARLRLQALTGREIHLDEAQPLNTQVERLRRELSGRN